MEIVRISLFIVGEILTMGLILALWLAAIVNGEEFKTLGFSFLKIAQEFVILEDNNFGALVIVPGFLR